MARFTPPNDGPVAFRRDQLPLDTDTIASLSRNVQGLAQGLGSETPEDRRAAAQMLALALALDPANKQAQEQVSARQEDKELPPTDAAKLDKNQARIWQLIAWLETPDAGTEGQALASCLKDVIVVSDPGHPKASAIIEAGEKGAWSGWVPGISAYQEIETPVANNEAEIPSEDAEQVQDPILKEASITSVMWLREGSEEEPVWRLGTTDLNMRAVIREHHPESVEGGQFQLTLGALEKREGFEMGDSLRKTSMLITKLLRKQHGKLPNNLKVFVSSKDLVRAIQSRRSVALSAPAAVLANAAITGVAPDAIVLGVVDESGSFKVSSSFWDQIQSLGKGSGRRLILPAESAEMLLSLLAMERPYFFMEYEVLLASDFKELAELSTSKPADSLAAPLAKFKEIRDRIGQQELRQYIGNTFIKQRLATVLQECPNHLSSKMLLVQSSGGRPTTISRKVLAAELRAILRPIDQLVSIEEWELELDELPPIGEIYEQSRAALERLPRYIQKPDQALFDEAKDVSQAVRVMERATRSRGYSWDVEIEVRKAHKELKRLHDSFTDTIAIELGQTRR